MTGCAVTAEEVNEFLREVGSFVRTNSVVVESVDVGEVVARWAYNPDVLRPGGYISGPTLFSVADLVGWVLCFTTEGITPMAVTWDLHITFLRPAVGGDVIARGRQLKRGRNLIYGEVEMFIDGAEDKPVAHATVTYALPQVPGT
jgi:uncharacterized protein (TIGR00369 family)